MTNILFSLLLLTATARAQDGTDLIDLKKQSSPPTPSEVQRVGKLLDLFYADCGRYPTTQEGLAALKVKPKTITCKSWGMKTKVGTSPYLTELPKEPWARLSYTADKSGQNYYIRPTKK